MIDIMYLEDQYTINSLCCKFYMYYHLNQGTQPLNKHYYIPKPLDHLRFQLPFPTMYQDINEVIELKPCPRKSYDSILRQKTV